MWTRPKSKRCYIISTLLEGSSARQHFAVTDFGLSCPLSGFSLLILYLQPHLVTFSPSSSLPTWLAALDANSRFSVVGIYLRDARRRSVVFAIPTGRSTCRWSVCVTADGRVVDLAKGTFKVQLASRVVAVSFFPLNGNLLVFCRLSFVTVIAFPSGTLPYPEFRREFPRRARQVRLLAFARARSMAAYTCMCVYVRMCARARAYIYINARNNSSVSDVLIDSFVYLHHLSICLSHWDGNNNNNNNCFSFTHQTLMILIIKS